MLLYLIGYNH